MPGPIDAPAPSPPVAPLPPVVNLPAGATAEPPLPLAEKLIGGVVAAAPNTASLNIDPFLSAWSGLLNVVFDKAKTHKYFPEHLTPYFVVVAGLGLGWLVYYQLNTTHDNVVALGKGAWIAFQAHTNWQGGKRLGVFQPTPDDKRFDSAAIKSLLTGGS